MHLISYCFMSPAFLLAVLLVTGCEGDGMVDIPGDDTEEVTFVVEYRAESSFSSCDVDFRDDDGDLTSLDDQTMPFAVSRTVEVEEGGTFEAVIAATCSGAQFVGNATARVIVDGSQRASETATGTSFTVTASTLLRAN